MRCDREGKISAIKLENRDSKGGYRPAHHYVIARLRQKDPDGAKASAQISSAASRVGRIMTIPRSGFEEAGRLSRDLPLHPTSGRDPRKRTAPDDESRKNHGVEPRMNSEEFNRRSRRSNGSGGKVRTWERKRTARRFPTSRPQERKVSPRRHPAYLRESWRQPYSLLSAYDGPHEQSPLLSGGGLSGRLGSRGQEARHTPPNKPQPTPPNDQSTNHKPSYAEVVACDVGEKLDKTTTNGGWQYVHRRRRPTTERRPINPSMEGRCYRCLARGHQAQSCREPVRCRLCHQAGH